MLKISESYIIGIDITDDGDESVISVCRNKGLTLEHVNTIFGKEAEELYEKLTNTKSRREKLS